MRAAIAAYAPAVELVDLTRLPGEPESVVVTNIFHCAVASGRGGTRALTARWWGGSWSTASSEPPVAFPSTSAPASSPPQGSSQP